MQTRMVSGPALASLPHYDPSCAERSDKQVEFVNAIREASGLVIGSPGYHGGVSGLVKNAIDLLEDTAKDDRPYLTDMPVAIIVSAAGWQASAVTLTSLRSIVHALRGWPTPLGITVNTTAQTVFEDGILVDSSIRNAVSLQASQILHLARQYSDSSSTFNRITS